MRHFDWVNLSTLFCIQIVLLVVFFLLFLPSSSFADTRGKLNGTIFDEKTKEPLVGVNILLVGTNLGGATDVNGAFTILNIPPATYEVRISSIGYGTKVVKDVRISSGETTTLNELLSEEAVQGQEVVVIAKRPVVDTRQTSAVNIMDEKDIGVLPVQELSDIVNLQAGVVDGHFRGGRVGEVQYQVDGVSINNPYDNSASIRIDKSIIQEVQVISGTFDAEYGQAMSGVVNAVLKSGSPDHFDYNAEVYSGQYTGSDSRFPFIARFRPANIQSYQLSLSGPTPLPSTTFLVSLRRYIDGGYLYGQRWFTPFDTSRPADNIFHPTGDSAIVSMNYFHELSGQGKLATRPSENTQLSYEIIFNQAQFKNYSFDWRFNPDGLHEPRRVSIVHGFDWTQTLSQSIFYTLSVRENYFDYKDLMYDNLYDPRYYIAKNGVSNANYELGAVVQGVDLGRFIQKTDSYVGKGSISWQATQEHLFKFGFEAQTSWLEFGSPGVLVATTNSKGVQLITPFVDVPELPHVVKSNPRWFSAFIQDKIEFTYLLIRGGIRLEVFDANTSVPGDLSNPANAIPGAPTSRYVGTTIKYAVAPRLGISYPVTDRSSVYFSYGHFYQYPALGDLFSNTDFSILRNLQAGGITYGVMGNPNLKPELTTQYEFGYKASLTESFGFAASVFYKDIRDLLGVEFISTYAAAEYPRFTNVDFGNVSGSTLSLDYKQGLLNASINYTYQTALGNSSDPRETATRAAAGEDPRPRVVPLAWDQRSTLNATLGVESAQDYSVNVIVRLQSGEPYTPSISSGFGGEIEANSGTKQSSVVVDLRAEKDFKLGSLGISAFVRITNLFGSTYSNGFVFSSTGSPYYSLVPSQDRNTLIDPSRYYAPRRIEVGLSLAGITN
ncbi:MAG TPA: TonB-dependent receptor [Bacteroidota bacterium]